MVYALANRGNSTRGGVNPSFAGEIQLSGTAQVRRILDLKRNLGSAWVSCGFRQRAKLDLVAELGDLGGQAPGFDLGGTAIEVVRTEIVMFGAVL